MKKTKLALIPLIALGLSACGNLPSDTSSIVPASSVTSSAAPASSAPASSKPASSAPASSKPSSSAPASSSTPVVKKDWNSDFKDGIAALNADAVIPYISEFGDNYEIDDSNLDYYGTFDAATSDPVVDSDPAEEGTVPTEIDEKEYFKTICDEFEGTGYTATVERLGDYDIPGKYYTGDYAVKAISADGTTTIYIYLDYQSYSSSAGYLTISVSLKTKYDKDSFQGYDKDELAECEAFIDGHTLPEIYLVSETPSGSFPSYFYGKNYYCFEGGSFYDQVITDAKAVLEADGWTVNVYSNDDAFVSYWPTSGGLIATKTYEDGCTVRIEIGDYGYYLKTTQMRVYLYEEYDETSATAWKSDTLTAMKDNLSGNTVPFVYLGTKNEDCAVQNGTSGDYIAILGNSWDDAIYENAKNALKADGYVVEEADGSDTTASWADGDAIIATKTLEDGSVIIVEVSYEYSIQIPEMRIYYAAPWTVPDTSVSWKEATQTIISENLGENVVIPYVYLGTINEVLAETASYETSYDMNSYVTIAGGLYTYTFGTYAKEVFEDAKWIISSAPSWTYAGGFTAYQYTEEGDLITVEVGADYSGMINLRITVEKHIDISSDKTWSTDDAAIFETNLGTDVTIPYIYLRLDTDQVYFEEATTYTAACVVISGGADGALLREYVKSVFEEDGWDVTTGDYSITTGQWAWGYSSDSCIVGKKNINGYTYSIEYGPYLGDAQVRIFKTANFVAPTEDEEWSSETKDLLDSVTGNHEVPFLCLQAENDTLSDRELQSYYDYGYLFMGGNWDDQCIDYIKAEFEAAGYEVTVEENTDDEYCIGTEGWCSGGTVLITGTKTFDDGSTVRVEVSDYYGSTASMMVFYSEPYRVPEDYAGLPDYVTDTFDYYVYGITLPEDFYIGSVVYWGYYAYSSEYDLLGTDWNEQAVADVKKSLEADGWTIESVTEASETSTGSFTASKENAFGETVTATLEESEGHILVYFVYDAGEEADPNETEYPDFIKDDMEATVGFSIPFVNFGSKNPVWYSSTEEPFGYLQVYGDVDMTNLIADIQAKDTEHEWEVVSGIDEDDYFIELRCSDGNDGYYVLLAENNASSSSGLYFYHQTKFVAPADGTNWDSSIQKLFYNMYGTSIPYVYLSDNAAEIETYYYLNDFYGEGMSTSGFFNYQDYYEYSLNSFQSDSSWTVTETTTDEGFPSFTATKDMGDYVVTASYMLYYSSPSYSDVYFYVTSNYKYIYPDTAGSWNTQINDILETYYSSATLPWIYLGCPDDAVTFDYYSYSDTLYIYGGAWDEDILSKAEASLKHAGWDVTVEEGYTDPDYPEDSIPGTLTASYTDADGNLYELSIEYDDWSEGPEVTLKYTPADEIDPEDPDDDDDEDSYSPIIIPGFTC